MRCPHYQTPCGRVSTESGRAPAQIRMAPDGRAAEAKREWVPRLSEGPTPISRSQGPAKSAVSETVLLHAVDGLGVGEAVAGA
jgi:hypothetical protein